VDTVAYAIGAVLMGVLCMAIANWKGRGIWLWGALGVVFGIITLIVLLVLPKVKKTQLA
jgi:hypothetical protein